MAYRWPAGTAFNRMTLDVEDRSCPVCGRYMHVCDHRYHHLWTFEGATQVINRLVRCPDPSCESRGRTFSPEAELSISMPRWCLGWDVFCGYPRKAGHSIASITYPHSLFALPRPGQRLNVRKHGLKE